MMGHLRLALHRQAYAPSWPALFFNAFYIVRSALWRVMGELGPQLEGSVLDVGCGSGPYRELLGCQSYLGMDIDSATTRERAFADVFYDGKQFPLESDRFQGVLCTQVLEHVFRPDEFLREIHRVMAPGGRLLLTVPFVWDEHEQPWDYARYSSFGLRHLLQTHGFKVMEERKLVADASALFQLANAYLYKVIRPLPRPLRLALTATLGAGVTILGVLAGKLLPSNPDFYLDNVILAEKC
jgi:SAM-dependent methyltransferase